MWVNAHPSKKYKNTGSPKSKKKYPREQKYFWSATNLIFKGRYPLKYSLLNNTGINKSGREVQNEIHRSKLQKWWRSGKDSDQLCQVNSRIKGISYSLERHIHEFPPFPELGLRRRSPPRCDWISYLILNIQ